MKVLVPIKRVVDYTVKIRLKADKSGIDLNNVKMSMNPFDEIAVEEAIRLKEKGIATHIIVVSIGSSEVQETLRHGLALGADEGIHIKTDSQLESLHIAKILAYLCEMEKPQLILMGKQAIDDDCNQTGQMLSALLDWPQATFASNIHIEQQQAFVKREIDGGFETLSLDLPCVITTDLRLNQPRFASLPNIIKARQKPIKLILLDELPIPIRPHLTILCYHEPPLRKPGVKVASVQELLEKLTQEAKVI
ncbi:MAG: electron transfer flavoprotein subunit beta/FixA family protein [Proteobacteria bacterium]|nr:electron transfer flavoprotein subunit beta/FixA family protein [Pseudomonadota bacterium]